MDISELKLCPARSRFARRWWLKCKVTKLIDDPNGFTDLAEFYVPFWAWPFELCHRMVFGYSRILKDVRDRGYRSVDLKKKE